MVFRVSLAMHKITFKLNLRKYEKSSLLIISLPVTTRIYKKSMQNRDFVGIHCTATPFDFMCAAAEVRKIIQQKAHGGGGGHGFDRLSRIRTKTPKVF